MMMMMMITHEQQKTASKRAFTNHKREFLGSSSVPQVISETWPRQIVCRSLSSMCPFYIWTEQ